MNENDQQNGLFSEDYEPPKRENPYLKKNREKAKAEKTPKPPKEKKRRPAEADSPYVMTEDKPPEAPDAPVTQPTYAEEDGYARKRTFSDWMFEHVKLIASLATVLVILTLVLITDVVDVVGNLVTNIQQADSETISMNYIYGLTQKSEPLQWSDFKRFRHEVSKADDSVTWKLPVDDQYELWVTGANTEKPPTQVWLIDWNTGDRMTLGVDDLEQFLAEHKQN